MFFLEKLNKYECFENNIWVPCTQNEICQDEENTIFRAIKNDTLYLDNWVEKLDLICEPHYRIGYIGSAFFAGLLVGLTFIPTISDKYGRRPVFNGCLIASVVFMLGLSFSNNLDFTLFCLVAMGVQWSCRFVVGLSYIDELIPPHHKENLIFSNFLFSASTNFLIPFIFWAFTTNWWCINIFGLIQIAFSILIVPWYVPESPKFYYENN